MVFCIIAQFYVLCFCQVVIFSPKMGVDCLYDCDIGACNDSLD